MTSMLDKFRVIQNCLRWNEGEFVLNFSKIWTASRISNIPFKPFPTNWGFRSWSFSQSRGEILRIKSNVFSKSLTGLCNSTTNPLLRNSYWTSIPWRVDSDFCEPQKDSRSTHHSFDMISHNERLIFSWNLELFHLNELVVLSTTLIYRRRAWLGQMKRQLL